MCTASAPNDLTTEPSPPYSTFQIDPNHPPIISSDFFFKILFFSRVIFLSYGLQAVYSMYRAGLLAFMVFIGLWAFFGSISLVL